MFGNHKANLLTDPEKYDNFGFSVSINSDYAIIGDIYFTITAIGYLIY